MKTETRIEKAIRSNDLEDNSLYHYLTNKISESKLEIRLLKENRKLHQYQFIQDKYLLDIEYYENEIKKLKEMYS